MKRTGMSRSYNKKVFRAGSGSHPKNMAPRPMRGGIRL